MRYRYLVGGVSLFRTWCVSVCLGVSKRDPWARFESWRHHPEISRAANIRRMFPGLGLGLAAFLALSAVEEFYWKPNHPTTSTSGSHHH